MIYGERGVGKTSLANIIGDLLRAQAVPVSKVNCTEKDSFSSTVRRAFDTIIVSSERHTTGLVPNVSATAQSVSARLPEGSLGPDRVARQLQTLPGETVLIFDEFDRLPHSETVDFADFIKAVSDRNLSTTVVMVAVAEDVGSLIHGHGSIERSLKQVYLQRMSNEELTEIIDGGLKSAGMELEGTVPLAFMLQVSQGFPHYAHLLAQHAARAAIDSGRIKITADDFFSGMTIAVDEADQSLRDTYHAAVTGTKKANIWKEVVAACATAHSDERGYFSGRAIGEQLGELLGRPIIQQNFAYHLGKLTEQSRGPLLERIGTERRYRYRFLRPLMRPFIIMKAIQDKLLTLPHDETGQP